MPIEYRIDDALRVVFVKGHGVLTDQEVFEYQHKVWSRPEVSGYDEFADMSGVTQVEMPSARRITDLAALSASMDPAASSSRLAIVATEDIVFGIGKMYQARRHLEPRSTREVAVFRSREPALRWMGIEGMVPTASKA